MKGMESQKKKHVCVVKLSAGIRDACTQLPINLHALFSFVGTHITCGQLSHLAAVNDSTEVRDERANESATRRRTPTPLLHGCHPGSHTLPDVRFYFPRHVIYEFLVMEQSADQGSRNTGNSIYVSPPIPRALSITLEGEIERGMECYDKKLFPGYRCSLRSGTLLWCTASALGGAVQSVSKL